MSQSDLDDTGYRGTNEGKELKATSGWDSNGNGIDKYGFAALPGGYRNDYSEYYHVGYFGFWWSATGGGASGAYGRGLSYYESSVFRTTNIKRWGFSVRCVRD